MASREEMLPVSAQTSNGNGPGNGQQGWTGGPESQQEEQPIIVNDGLSSRTVTLSQRGQASGEGASCLFFRFGANKFSQASTSGNPHCT